MENNKGNGIFLGVIGVATLIVAIIGATFAFFSANAQSGVNAINTTSTSLALGFAETSNLKTKLIPAADNIALYGANNQSGVKECIDDASNEICSTYTFTVMNPSTSAQRIYTSMVIQINDFANLYFAVFDETGTTQLIGPTPVKAPSEGTPVGVSYSTNSDGKNVVSLTALDQYLARSTTEVTTNINNKESYTPNTETIGTETVQNMKTFKMIFWIHETGLDQPDDTSSTFAAGLKITTSSGSSGVTGTIAAASGNDEP